MKRELIQLLTYRCVNDHSLALVSGGYFTNPCGNDVIICKQRNDDQIIPTELKPHKK